MKIFEFDPKTGRRGDYIETRRPYTYGGQSVAYQVGEGLIEPIQYREPKFGKDADVTVRVDAGRMNESYQFEDRWVCFCLGQRPHDGMWEWSVVVPRSAIQAKPQECACCGEFTMEWDYVPVRNEVDLLCVGCQENEIGEACSR